MRRSPRPSARWSSGTFTALARSGGTRIGREICRSLFGATRRRR
ncbi:DUF853 domain-containing protein [Streptomyces cinnamoneus]|nr:DUF853 domain-containing protein [Streptomyces cinnamoneus]